MKGFKLLQLFKTSIEGPISQPTPRTQRQTTTMNSRTLEEMMFVITDKINETKEEEVTKTTTITVHFQP